MDVDGTVRALFAAFSARDVEDAVGLSTEDVSVWPEGTAARVGRQAPYEGRDGIRRYFDDLKETWRKLDVEPQSTRIAGQGVIAFGRARGTTWGGDEVDVPVIWVIKLRDDRIASIRAVATAEEAQRVARA